MASAPDAPYLSRPLAGSIARSTSPVVILQGPPGVGKTALVTHEPALSHFYYVSLSDEETLQQARQQPVAWVSSLSRPAIIDDAHLLDGLLEAVLEVAPKKAVTEPFFVLVSPRALHARKAAASKPPAKGDPAPPAPGSAEDSPASTACTLLPCAAVALLPAASPQATLPAPSDAATEGATAAAPAASAAPASKPKKKSRWRKGPRKPLKPQCLTLFPLTQAELCERDGCVVDDLFDRRPQLDFHSTCTLSDLRTMMRVGGFPAYATQAAHLHPQERSAEVRQRIRAMLDDGAPPKADMDRLVERSILKRLLSCPGLPLGLNAVARACYVDPPTLTAHLGFFLDRLLAHRVAHLGKRNRNLAFAKTRLYPLDTTFSVEALRDDELDIAVSPVAFGRVLRGLCIGQLLPAAQWASEPTECCHWKLLERNVKPNAKAVDLVLLRKDRLVAIKVRNSLLVRADQLGGLSILAKDERFVHGFVIYLGSTVMQLADNIWAIPVSALWERSAFHPSAAAPEGEEGAPGEAQGREEADDPLCEEDEDLAGEAEGRAEDEAPDPPAAQGASEATEEPSAGEGAPAAQGVPHRAQASARAITSQAAAKAPHRLRQVRRPLRGGIAHRTRSPRP